MSLKDKFMFAGAVLLCVTLVFFLIRDMVNGKKENKELKKDLSERKLHKLKSTKQNVAGQVKNFLQESIDQNSRWGHLLEVEVVGEGVVSLVSVYGLPMDGLKKTQIDRFRVMVDTTRGSIYVSTVGAHLHLDTQSDPELPIFVRENSQRTRDWKPSPASFTPPVYPVVR